MNTDKRQHLQDIYATDRSDGDEFTPQVSAELQEERKRDLRRQQAVSFSLGAIVLLLVVALVYFIVSDLTGQDLTVKELDQPSQGYIPRHSLANESQWVMDFSRSFADPAWDGEGERPLNTLWLKKASYNLVMAEQALRMKKFSESSMFYENVLEIFPEIEGVKIPYAMVLFNLKEFEKATVLLENENDEDLPHDILSNLGAAFIEAENNEKAVYYLERSLELKPAYPSALKNMAVLQRKMEQPEKAISYFERYLDIRPTDTDTRYEFALYLSKQTDNMELAGEQLRILTEKVTNVSNLYYLLAEVETKLGNSEAAVTALQRVVQLTDPNLAGTLISKKEFDELRNKEAFKTLIDSVQ